MNPADLLAPPSPIGAPAPYWLLVGFKVLGFTLHLVPMNLWYAGVLVALVLHSRGSEPARLWASRLLKQMPLFVAVGVNFGIVPLLFIQVSYYRVFYPATILMAWPWMSIIALLTLAYYGVYAYAIGLKSGRIAPWQRTAGWVAALFFAAIGFLFANGMSLMTRLDSWPELWQRTSVGGATPGMALDTSDPTLWPRWLMLLGLALTTTAVHAIVDSGVFAGRDAVAYRRWAAGFAAKLYGAGLVWFAVMGSWYAFGTWAPEVRARMLAGPLLPLTVLTAVAPGLVGLLLLAQRRGVTRALAWATGAAQLGVLGLNAVSRQVVQNLELRRYYDVTSEPVRTQWSPLVVFLVLFAGGVVLLVWMVRRVVAAERDPGRSEALAAGGRGR